MEETDPSPVYQCRKAFRLNMAVNWSETRLNRSWIAVELPMNVTDILSPRGAMSQWAVWTLFGTGHPPTRQPRLRVRVKGMGDRLHSTKNVEFRFWTESMFSSTSFIETFPRK